MKEYRLSIIITGGMVNIESDEFIYGNILRTNKEDVVCGFQASDRLEPHREDFEKILGDISAEIYKLQDLIDEA